ncbi:hypothetical protein CCZ01_04885 [Helicobacter monodelphidis]|uniref:YraN family protein n=1 Tax=Helicobacter sp. 15-1451 TaxID=2004995 RepID=UPI000DCCD20A|nr:YraN family protein [Helicobacter sp. 15-1451]RAX57785.1 hypothetical protein CCZ01_04885 [Helicobacter sp. 15-1451]
MSRQKGNIAEEKAAQFLQQKKFKIIERNFYTPFGEIDIIAEKKKILHFVEVKSGESFEPIYNITPIKMQRIIRSLEFYLSQNGITREYCVDALIVCGEKLELIENITL